MGQSNQIRISLLCINVRERNNGRKYNKKMIPYWVQFERNDQLNENQKKLPSFDYILKISTILLTPFYYICLCLSGVGLSSDVNIKELLFLLFHSQTLPYSKKINFTALNLLFLIRFQKSKVIWNILFIFHNSYIHNFSKVLKTFCLSISRAVLD